MKRDKSMKPNGRSRNRLGKKKEIDWDTYED